MDGEAQPAIDTPLDHAQDKATTRVEWALTPMGLCRPKEDHASAIASTNHREILCFVTGDPLVWWPKHTKSCSDCLNGVDRWSTPGLPSKEGAPRE